MLSKTLESRTEEWYVHGEIWKGYHTPGTLEGHAQVQVCTQSQVICDKEIKLSALADLDDVCKREKEVKDWRVQLLVKI